MKDIQTRGENKYSTNLTNILISKKYSPNILFSEKKYVMYSKVYLFLFSAMFIGYLAYVLSYEIFSYFS